MELVKPDGRIAAGPQCIYHLPGGITFYSEAVRQDGECYIFDPAKTLAVFVQPPQPNGQQQVAHMKGFGPQVPFLPTVLRVGRSACVVTDCTDARLLEMWRSTVLGIVLAGADYQMPPRGK